MYFASHRRKSGAGVIRPVTADGTEACSVSKEMRMRTILILAAGALALAACAAPTVTAINAGQPQAAGMASRDEEPPVPATLRRPQRTLKNWSTTGSGGMY